MTKVSKKIIIGGMNSPRRRKEGLKSLHLTLDKNVTTEAKKKALDLGISLSELVENFLKNDFLKRTP